MHSSDGNIVYQCLSGEPEAFGLLVDKYRQSIYALVFSKIGNFADAEDLTQEIFIQAYEKLGTLRRWDGFLAWLYSIASNRCKNFHRALCRKPDAMPLSNIDESLFESRSIEDYEEKLSYEQLYDALAELKPIYRQVLSLYYLGGMNNREIARFLGASPDTIRSRLRRARAKLKKEMITMMSQTFDEMRLQPGFTFRIVEAIKQTKIQPPPSKMTLPFGVSAAMGLIVLLLSLSLPYSPLYPIGQFIGSALPPQTQVLEDGIIPVDAIEITQIVSLSQDMEKGDFGRKPTQKPVAFLGGTWEKKTELPPEAGGRVAHSSNTVNGRIYVIGGVSDDRLVRKTVFEYDPATNMVQKKAEMLSARAGHSSSVVNGKIYVLGGFVWDGRVGVYKTVETIAVYDPALDRWDEVSRIPIPRIAHCSGVVDGKIYVIGGSRIDDKGAVGQLVVQIDVYDPRANKWTKGSDMSTPRGDPAVAVVNRQIYVIGGTEGPPGWATIASVEMYDIGTNTWKKVTEMPTPRLTPCGSVLNGSIYVIGGMDVQRRVVHFANVDVYHPTTNTWTREADMLRARSNLSTSVVNGKIYAIAGDDANVGKLADIEEFTPVPTASVSPHGKLTTTWAGFKANN